MIFHVEIIILFLFRVKNSPSRSIVIVSSIFAKSLLLYECDSIYKLNGKS
jgi:hypothetical protein